MQRWAEIAYRRRVALAVAIAVLTAIFGWRVRSLDISTHFLDLYPSNSAFVKLFEQYPKFGSPLTVSILIRVRHGDIYNPATLAKIKEATRLSDLIPGVDHDSILSIASKKVKHSEATVSGIQSSYLLVGAVPQSAVEIAKFREKVGTTAGVIGTLVSARGDAALVQATFIDRLIDYDTVFNQVNHILAALADDNHELYAAGQPMLTGWVYHYEREMYLIFGIGFLTMLFLLAVYFRNIVGVLIPAIVALVSATWGFGFASVLGYNLDPLIIVVPILLVARALSHSVQMCERYFELYDEEHDVAHACIHSFVSLFPPGFVGVVCDAAGIFLIAIAPIGVVRKLAFVCGLWSLSLVITAITLTFVLLSFFPPPRNVEELVLSSEHHEGPLYAIFQAIAFFSATPARSIGTCAAFLLIVVLSIFSAHGRVIGDVNPGTSLLWPTSPYNTAVREINQRLAGFDIFQVVAESDNPLGGVLTAQGLETMQRLERHMAEDPQVGGTFSFADLVSPVNRLFHGGLPKFNVIPGTDTSAAMTSQLAMSGASPGDFDRFLVPGTNKAASISVWYKDHRGPTVARALERARDFIARNPMPKGFRIRLATGTIGLLAAVNHIIEPLELVSVILISLIIFAITSFVYRSFTAGFLLLLVSNIAYLMTCAVMYLKGIGLDVDTFPVAAVGIGIGIDYNIYLMSRMSEEYLVNPDYSVLVPKSIFTTGKAIFFTATTMIAGVVIWYFLSDLRFQADMGLLLASVMLAHVILALFFQAAVMQLVRPRFIGKRSTLGGEAAGADEIGKAALKAG